MEGEKDIETGLTRKDYSPNSLLTSIQTMCAVRIDL